MLERDPGFAGLDGVVTGKLGPAKSEFRIEINGLAKILYRFGRVLRRDPVDEVTGKHHQALGFGIAGAALDGFGDLGLDLFWGNIPEQARPQLLDDRLSDVILHRKNVFHRPVIRLGPDVIAVGGIDELDRNANSLSGHSNTALKDRGHIQRTADLGYGRLLALERERRRPCRHAKAADL